MKASLLQRAAGAALFALLTVTVAQAHGGHAGDIEIEHPFATPTPPGAVNGAAYVVSLENSGKSADKLLKVSTPVAQRAEIHSMAVDAGGVMRMREVDGIDIAPGATVKMKPGDGYHFMLIGLKQPLKEGDSFPLTMEFAHGGKTEVKVIVQVPKAHGVGGMDAMADHKH
jgi:periplasmic copper chaperone A